MGSPRSPRGVRRAAVLAVVVLALGVFASFATASVAVAHQSSKDLKISGVWARTSPSEAANGAVYLTVKNTGTEANAIVGVRVPRSVAADAQIHETKVDASGTMQMAQVDRIDLPAGKTVRLQPGGYHVMLMELAKPLEKGRTFRVTLQFESGRNQRVKAVVKDAASPGSMSPTAPTGSM